MTRRRARKDHCPWGQGGGGGGGGFGGYKWEREKDVVEKEEDRALTIFEVVKCFYSLGYGAGVKLSRVKAVFLSRKEIDERKLDDKKISFGDFLRIHHALFFNSGGVPLDLLAGGTGEREDAVVEEGKKAEVIAEFLNSAPTQLQTQTTRTREDDVHFEARAHRIATLQRKIDKQNEFKQYTKQLFDENDDDDEDEHDEDFEKFEATAENSIIDTTQHDLNDPETIRMNFLRGNLTNDFHDIYNSDKNASLIKVIHLFASFDMYSVPRELENVGANTSKFIEHAKFRIPWSDSAFILGKVGWTTNVWGLGDEAWVWDWRYKNGADEEDDVTSNQQHKDSTVLELKTFLSMKKDLEREGMEILKKMDKVVVEGGIRKIVGRVVEISGVLAAEINPVLDMVLEEVVRVGEENLVEACKGVVNWVVEEAVGLSEEKMKKEEVGHVVDLIVDRVVDGVVFEQNEEEEEEEEEENLTLSVSSGDMSSLGSSRSRQSLSVSSGLMSSLENTEELDKEVEGSLSVSSGLMSSLGDDDDEDTLSVSSGELSSLAASCDEDEDEDEEGGLIEGKTDTLNP